MSLARVAAVQGNFDVALLQAGASTVKQVEEAVSAMLDDFGTQGLVANLGEGLSGKEDPVLVAAFIDSVHSVSAVAAAAAAAAVAVKAPGKSDSWSPHSTITI